MADLYDEDPKENILTADFRKRNNRDADKINK
jgi:hypothetical protein